MQELVKRYYVRRLYYYEKNFPGAWRRLGEGECNSIFFTTVLDTSESYHFGRVHYSAYFQKALKNNLIRSAREMGLFAEPVLSLDHYEGEEEEGSTLHDVVAAPSSFQSDPSRAYENKEAAKILHNVLRKMNKTERSVVLARYNGDSIRVISKRLGLSPKKVRLILEKALRQFKKALKGFTYKDFEGLL